MHKTISFVTTPDHAYDVVELFSTLIFGGDEAYVILDRYRGLGVKGTFQDQLLNGTSGATARWEHGNLVETLWSKTTNVTLEHNTVTNRFDLAVVAHGGNTATADTLLEQFDGLKNKGLWRNVLEDGTLAEWVSHDGEVPQ